MPEFYKVILDKYQHINLDNTETEKVRINIHYKFDENYDFNKDNIFSCIMNIDSFNKFTDLLFMMRNNTEILALKVEDLHD